MRILHCIPSLGGAGAERQLTYLCEGLSKQGHEVHVALLNFGVHFVRLKRTSSTIHRVSARSSYDPTISLRLYRLIRSINPDVVQTWLPMMDVYGGVAARLAGVPWILSERCSEGAYTLSRHWLRTWLARGCTAVVANSRSGKAYWQGRIPDRIPRFVIRNVLPLSEIRAAEAINRSPMGIRPDQRLILSVGRLTQGKNVETLLRALPKVLSEVDAVTVILGDGPCKPDLTALCDTLDIGDRVRFLGYVDNSWSWMKAADLFVSLSRFEGMPNSVMEALGCGCRLVLSEIGEHRGIAAWRSNSARFIDATDLNSVSEAIVDQLHDFSVEVGTAGGHPRLPEQWGLSAVTEAYCGVYGLVASQSALSRGSIRTVGSAESGGS